MLQASSPQSTSRSPAASFFARINSPPTSEAGDASGSVHRNGALAGATGGPAVTTEDRIANSGSDISAGPPLAGNDLRRAVSLRSPVNAPGGMSSFTSAGSDMASSACSASSGYAPPLASRHALFSHHALPPAQPIHTSRPFSPTDTVMSDPGARGHEHSFDASSDASGGTFSAASMFLSNFGRGRSLSIAGLPEVPPAPDAQGAQVGDYTLGKIVGRGGFSTVRQATNNRTGEVVACKIVRRADLSDQSGSLECFEDEIRIWKDLPEHPFLLPLLEMHRTTYATFLFMPLLAGGSLLEVLQREGGSDKTARRWFPGVVNAVVALHEGFDGFGGHMLHGDLKLDNFITDLAGGLRLGDFGMARILPKVESKPSLPPHLHPRPRLFSVPTTAHPQTRGRSPYRGSTFTAGDETRDRPSTPMPAASLPYAPPELLRAPPGPPSLKQDIWAIGVILFALLTGRLPFADSYEFRLQAKIIKGEYEVPPHLGQEWFDALAGCLAKRLEERWDIEQVRQSDAVTGWRTARKMGKSRSRSRARHGPDSPSYDGIPIPSRGGRDRSRSRMRHHGGGTGSVGSPHSHHSHYSHHRGPSNTERDLPSPREEATDHPFLRRAGFESRSRSASSRRGRLSGDVHALLATSNDDGLIDALNEVSITRGRRTYRADVDQPQLRDASASSLHVPDPLSRQSRSPSASRPNSGTYSSTSAPSVGHTMEPPRARSRTRLDGTQVPVPGSGPPTVREQHWQQQQQRPRGSPSWQSESRPPTFGSELTAVDEEERGRRGRPLPSSGDRSRSRRRMMEY